MNQLTNSRKWWKVDKDLTGQEPSTGQPEPATRGRPCPKCYMADMDYDTLFRLHCPNCGYIAECGAFT